jgi:hypothetical protein
MMIRAVQHIFLRPDNPFVSHDFAAGITEPGFAGMSHIFFAAAGRAHIHSISQFVLVAATHDFFHVFQYRVTDIAFIQIIKIFPKVFENLLDCIIVRINAF